MDKKESQRWVSASPILSAPDIPRDLGPLVMTTGYLIPSISKPPVYKLVQNINPKVCPAYLRV